MTEALRADILKAVAGYHAQAFPAQAFVPGKSAVPVSGRVFDAGDLVSLVDASLDFWLTTGRFNDSFEERLSRYLGVKRLYTVNSGSSANLLAFAALTSHLLGDRALKPGDEVVSVAAGFPTTLNPILLYGCVPVFVDVELPTYNTLPGLVEAALTEKTRAIFMAHTLGNPFDAEAIAAIAKKRGLWLIEDCCDALGGTLRGRKLGTFGDLATLSFYPAHHITMGEGGAVFTDNLLLGKAVESLRDWGRDCWCATGKDNTCGKRYGWSLGELPEGYDHKYIYSHLGYNLKITDMQAAVGLAQLGHLDDFCARRRENFSYFKGLLKDLEDQLVLPEATEGGDPAWFGFPMSVREGASFKRYDLLKHLDAARIGTRLLFGGNLTRQPYMKGRHYRLAAPLTNTDRIMRDTFWTGTYPGLTKEMLDYSAQTIRDFIRRR
ncbi:MAG TPA: lipopolysaccharide biosynthesis protein RfbH [bacterium]|jgi:CDP-6-deoxy-D-xylo-4-hexulose-3-dehydrase|nr:lipopolysaccharide biosynthesis protein RfbH [bacterium]